MCYCEKVDINILNKYITNNQGSYLPSSTVYNPKTLKYPLYKREVEDSVL